jgi:hypothetical protein
MQTRIRMNSHDVAKVRTIMTELDGFDLDMITDAICQAMEVEQGHDRDHAHAIAKFAITRPERFGMGA